MFGLTVLAGTVQPVVGLRLPQPAVVGPRHPPLIPEPGGDTNHRRNEAAQGPTKNLQGDTRHLSFYQTSAACPEALAVG